jgi:hypothetical protein
MVNHRKLRKLTNLGPMFNCLKNVSLYIAQPYGPPWPVAGIALLLLYYMYVFTVTDMATMQIVWVMSSEYNILPDIK